MPVPRVRTRALALLAAGALAPAAARAQARALAACVFGPFQTCSTLSLTTTAVNGGTDVFLLVRQTTLGDRPTGLTSLAFYFGGSGGDAAPLRPTLLPSRGLPSPEGPARWSFQGTATRLDLLHDPVTPDTPAAATQFIGGCAGGAFGGGLLATSLVTCAPGSYGFLFRTDAMFSAADVTGFGLELYAGTDDEAPNGRTVTCGFDALAADGSPAAGACLDFANLVDPSVPFGPGQTEVVPEPATLALAGAGLAALAAARRRRR
jgi:hypothetical protein